MGKLQAGGAAENISLVTECGSRKLYLISATATGLTSGKNFVYRNNVYTLMSLTMAKGKPTLDIIKKDDDEEQGASCDARASGTHFVDKGGNLRRYCSQKLGTRFRESVGSCLVPTAPDFSECRGFPDFLWDKDCYNAVPKTIIPGAPTGLECTDYLQLDDHMSFTER
ncbi:MAG TPA: hypothetical protein VE954_21075 [Oligoflexus sp.]|uniref:hypothetical protein n=1 Tax=Oligoflexus sp. TaxID=1971216 RepID=UPI002D6F4D31|nr:hypothetical protein [Oligoflexus sp.]HYX35598.1 hypothetical protein [Oligoflexus sp.]